MQITTPYQPALADRRWQIVRAMLGLNIIALWAMFFGGQWDAAEHAKGAVDRFWYPPHYGIYFALLVSLLVSGAGLVMLLRGPGLPFDKLRRNAALTLVVIANALNVSAAPFDAWWHTVFGLDLTVWSPPHLHMLLGTVLAALGCAVYFLDDRPAGAPMRRFRSFARRDAWLLGALLIALLIGSFMFIEYEMNVLSRDVLARPDWTYPLLWPWFAGAGCALVAAITRRVGMATLLGGLYIGARLLIMAFNQVVLNYDGGWFYPLLIPALAFDLGLILLWPRLGLRRPWLAIAAIGLLVAAVVTITTPLWWSWLGGDPRLRVTPWSSAWPISLISGTLGALLGWWGGATLRRLRPTPESPTVGDVVTR